MSAPIRQEHREAARAYIHTTASERVNEIGGVVQLMTEWMEPHGADNERRLAQLLADTEAAARLVGARERQAAITALILGGRFLHDEAPAAKFAREAVAAIERELPEDVVKEADR